MNEKEKPTIVVVDGVEYLLNFGEYLRKKREEKNFSQVKLAEKLEIHKSSICKYEKGITLFPTKKLIRLAQVLDISYVELVRAHHIDDRADHLIQWEFDMTTRAPLEEYKATIGDMVFEAKDLIDHIQQSYLPLVINILRAFANDYSKNLKKGLIRPNIIPERYDDSDEV